MTTEAAENVSPGAVAPVRREIRVACDVDTAFELFTAHIGTWWPLGTHSVFGARASVAFEGFNIFNSTNFGCYDGFIPAPPSTNAKFGTPSCTVDGSSRRLQFGLRYVF